jgi:quercetin dioxygenase-like cupin family protein
MRVLKSLTANKSSISSCEKGIYNDNGNKVDAVPGMVTFTPSGEGHAIKNTGDDMLTFIALIVLD